MDMIDNFIKFSELLDKRFYIQNQKLNEILKSYTFIHVNKFINKYQYPNIYENFKQSKLAIINQIEDNKKIDDQFLIIGFKQILIIVNKSSISFLQNLFSFNSDVTIYILNSKKDVFDQNIQVKNKILFADQIFLSEIKSFGQHFSIRSREKTSISSIWFFIQPCISGYLIKQSYEKTIKKRLEGFSHFCEANDHYSMIETWDINDFISLRTLSSSSLSIVSLVYSIEKEELFAIKKRDQRQIEYHKLKEREQNNYSILNYPLFPKFYGIYKNLSIIEYINGKTLDEIGKNELGIVDRIRIFFELILIFEYFYEMKFIYRDLKPNNIIIDQNKNVVLIDFDRMVSYDDIREDRTHTNDFYHNFVAPEVNYGMISYQNDIYSLGRMYYYLMDGIEI